MAKIRFDDPASQKAFEKLDNGHGPFNRRDGNIYRKEVEFAGGVEKVAELLAPLQYRNAILSRMETNVKRQVGKARWNTDIRPLLADPTLTAPAFDFGSGGALHLGTGPWGQILGVAAGLLVLRVAFRASFRGFLLHAGARPASPGGASHHGHAHGAFGVAGPLG